MKCYTSLLLIILLMLGINSGERMNKTLLPIDSLSGFYTIEKVDKQHLYDFISDFENGKRTYLQCHVNYDIQKLISNAEDYLAIKINLNLSNGSKEDIECIKVLSEVEDVYIENGFLICDAPLLPSGFSGYSHDETWIICKTDFIRDNLIGDFHLYIQGQTVSGKELRFNVNFHYNSEKLNSGTTP